MHERVYLTFESLLASEALSGRVLEVGAEPNESALLNSSVFDGLEKVGLNIEGGKFKDFTILSGNANDMEMFDDNAFDCIVSNATFEHDLFFGVLYKKFTA